MGAIIDPDAKALHIFAWGDRGGRAGDGNEIPLATDLDAQDAEATGFAVKSDALNGALQAFQGLADFSGGFQT